jgi:hypothetical protein
MDEGKKESGLREVGSGGKGRGSAKGIIGMGTPSLEREDAKALSLQTRSTHEYGAYVASSNTPILFELSPVNPSGINTSERLRTSRMTTKTPPALAGPMISDAKQRFPYGGLQA